MNQTLAAQQPNQSTQNQAVAALNIDGYLITADDVRRLVRQLQRANSAFMHEVFAHNRTRQLLARYEHDCAYLPEQDLFYVSRAGLDILDELERGA